MIQQGSLRYLPEGSEILTRRSGSQQRCFNASGTIPLLPPRSKQIEQA